MPLGFVEGRVVGSLIEKQLTTPEQYPLTLNALVLACNQTSNRFPVVTYDAPTVEAALATLKSAGLVRFVHPSHGRSATRYRQVLEVLLSLGDRQLALLGVLLLRGAQTAGELRGRTERMTPFEGTDVVDAELDAMSSGPDALVVKQSKRPGQQEHRWIQLLADGDGAAEASLRQRGSTDHDTSDAPGPAEPTAAGRYEPPISLVELANQVAGLRAEVTELRSALEYLQSQLGG